MKNHYLIFILILFIVSACDNNEPTVVDGEESKNTETKFKLSNKIIDVGSSAGTAYISVISNTDWTVAVNNSSNLPGLDVSPLSGKNDGTVKVKYNAVTTTYYDEQSATIIFYYYSYGYRQAETVKIRRKGKYL